MKGFKKLFALIIAGILFFTFCGCSNSIKTESEPSQKQDVSSQKENSKKNDNVIETRYFYLTLPKSWKDNYYLEMTSGSGYDYETDEFEYVVSFSEKGGYMRNGAGHLVDIILTADSEYDSFARGEMIGVLTLEKPYYFFARYPSDVQSDIDNRELYVKMSGDVDLLLSTITPRDKEAPFEIYKGDKKQNTNSSESAKPEVENSVLGTWVRGNKYDDCYECELTITKADDKQIVFNLFYYRIWGEDDITATFKGDKAFFDSCDGSVGFITISGNKLNFTLTKSPIEYVKTGTFEYTKK